MGLLKKIKEKRKALKQFAEIRKLALRYLNILRKKRDEIEIEQRRLLTDFLLYVQSHSPYYKKLLLGKDITVENCINVMSNLPLCSKELIRKYCNMIYSDEVGDNWKNWLNTGGSTGEPLRFPIKSGNINLEQVHQMMLYFDMGWDFNDLIVSIDGSVVNSDARSRNIYFVEGDNFPYGKYSFSTLYMSDETLPYYVKDLNTIKPSVLRGYPSGIMRLAKYILENKCKLSFKLKGAYLTSEFFSEEDRAIIQNVFRCKVYGQYGHTEASVFAVSKNDSSYLCSPFYGFTEVVDEYGNHVNIGETGEIVVTGFLNLAIPFIRYKTGDLAEYGGRENGVVRLKSLRGRTVDYIINKYNKRIYLVGLIFGGHIEALNHINDWQIEQSEVGKVLIRIVKGVGYKELISQELIDLFGEYSIDVSFLYVAFIPVIGNGKKKFMIQHLCV